MVSAALPEASLFLHRTYMPCLLYFVFSWSLQCSPSWWRAHLLLPDPKKAGLPHSGGAEAQNCSAPHFIPLARHGWAQTDVSSSPSTAGWDWIPAIHSQQPGWTQGGAGWQDQRHHLEGSLLGGAGELQVIADGRASGKNVHVQVIVPGFLQWLPTKCKG